MHTAISAALIIITTLVCDAASGQTLERLPSGSTLVTQLLQFSGKHGDLQSRVNREVSASIVFTPSGRELIYSTGRTEKYDKRLGIVEVKTSSGTRTFEGKYLLHWLPEDGNFTATRKTTESYTVPDCGIIDAEYTITPSEKTQRVQIRGADLDVKVTEFVLDGRWVSGRCGDGKRVLKFSYSRELDAVLANEFTTFDRFGSLIAGNGIRVVRIE
jgi:hypothetical protein